MIYFQTSKAGYPLVGSFNRDKTGTQLRLMSNAVQVVIDSSISAEVAVTGGHILVEYTKPTN